MKQIIKQMVVGTPLEGVARRVWRAFRPVPPPPPPAPAPAAPPAMDLNTLYDRQTAEVIARVLAKDSNCVDVGCHHGLILDEMLRHAPDGTHFAFEPLPHLFAGLKDKYAGRANVRLFEAALSEAAGNATFQHVVTNPGYSGLLRRRFDRPHEDVVEIRVNLLRLDDVVPPDLPIRLVKIDVEGAELQVLRGAAGLLRRWRPIVVFEHGLGGSDIYGTRPEMVFDLFASCGMKVSLMGAWLASHGETTLTREGLADEFDSARNYYFMAHP